VVAAALLAQSAATPAPIAGMTAALTLPAAAPSQDKLKVVNLAKLVMEQLSLAMKAEMENPRRLSTWMWRQTMSWMWAFLKATMIPGLIVGIGVRFLYHTLFKPFPLRRVRRTKCYHTLRPIDRHRHRANVHQGNDGMYRGRPLHKTNSKPSQFHRKKKRESRLERELRQNRRCPPKPPQPRPSERKDGYRSDCHEKEDRPEMIPMDLHLFQDSFDSLPLKCNEKPKPHVNDNIDGWESESEETLNDGPQSLDQALLHAFIASIDPLVAFNKIKQVAFFSTPVRSTKKAKRSKTYRQTLLSAALITGYAVSATAPVYSSHKEDCVPIVIGTGASVSVTPVLTDFLVHLRPCATANLKGLSRTTEVIGEGTVNWVVRDMFLQQEEY
jgi:hypothetical protein